MLCLASLNVIQARADVMDETKLPPPAQVRVEFLKDIQPILEGRCLKCHSGEKPKSNFRLDTRESALRGGRHGVDIVPGQSGKSPLIYFVAGLVEDMEMPPSGRGTPLTPEELALMRAWIDQGLVWTGKTPEQPGPVATITPLLGYTSVSGDTAKFRELTWQHEGWNRGLENFEVTDKPGPDSRITFSGHALRDDYLVTLTADKNDLGFTHMGWSQFRKYYDDNGGYYPLFTPSSYSLNRDLNLDVGRGWADFGLTLPNWPSIALGYEYQYRNGTEATLQWGPVNPSDPKNIYPGFEQVAERVHIFKFDLDYDVAGVSLSDSFRAEWYHLATEQLDENLATNGAPAMPFTQVDERQKYFQGANAFHAEKQFTSWLFGAGGYLYSKLDADGSLSMQQLNLGALDLASLPLYSWNANGIELERESHVFSLSGLVGPWEGLSLSLGTQNEWTRQMGFGTAQVAFSDAIFRVLGFTNLTQLFGEQTDLSDLDHRAFNQTAGVRFTRIPFTTVFADARFQQEQYGQSQQQIGGEFSEIAASTVATSHLTDLRAGFNTSPWRRLSLSGEFRRYDNETDYNPVYKFVGSPNEGYPAFIDWRDLLSTEAQGKVALQWTAWLKTSLSYEWLENHYHTATEPVTFYQGTTGSYATSAPLEVGLYDAHIATLNATFTPGRKWVLTSTFTYQNARTTTEANGSTAVVPYSGSTYTVTASGDYALNATTSLAASYAFSEADFGQANLTGGLPLGLTYHQHTLQVGLKHQLAKNATVGLQYRFYYYKEPSQGGLGNFVANGVFGTLACSFP